MLVSTTRSTQADFKGSTKGVCIIEILPENEGVYVVDGREAARIIGISQRAVLNLATQQRLDDPKRKGKGASARLMVSLASVERLRLERQWEYQASNS